MDTDVILQAAIEKLTNIINVATGLAHPLDDSRAKELLRALYENQIPTPGSQVLEICLQLGWPERHAKQFSELAEKVNNGGGVRVSHPRHWGETVVDELVSQYG